MKKIFSLYLVFAFLNFSVFSQVKIGGTGTPNASAVLELDGGTDKGLLLPRISTAQMTAMNTAPDGMMIFNNSDGFIYVRKAAAWQKVSDATNGGGGFTLPYSGSVNTLGGSAFSISQTGNFSSAAYFTAAAGEAIRTGAGNLKLNEASGNTGIGLPSGINDNPSLAKLVVRGLVGNTNALFGDNTTGISIENNSPGIGFNSYYNAGRKAIAAGYSGLVSFDAVNGKLFFGTSAVSGAAGATIDGSFSTKMTVDKNGFVGIGTTAPSNFFTVRRDNAGITQESADGVVKVGFFTGAAGAFVQTHSNHPLGFTTNNGQSQMTLLTNGNFGVGTEQPAYKLTVAANNQGIMQETLDGSMKLGLYTNTTTGAIVQTQTNHALNFATNNGSPQATLLTTGNFGIGTTSPAYKFVAKSDGVGLVQESSNGLVKVGFYTSAAGAFLETVTNHPLNFSTNDGAIQASLSTAGFFGIGNIVPAYRLDVNGRMRIRHITNSTAGIWFNNSQNVESSFIGKYTDTKFGFYGGNGWKFLIDDNDGALYVGSTNFDNENLTNAAGYKLKVFGKIIGEEVRVQLKAAWPDYVFANNYKLKSLAEVEQFIADNKHLPDMPSAAEVEKDGQHLGEIQRKMMEKIEELTLYVIDLKKEIELLKKNK